MSFQDTYRISNADRLNKGVYGLPDTPGLSTTAMQERFDSLGNLTIEKFNKLVDDVEETLTDDPKLVTAAAVKAYTDNKVASAINDSVPSNDTTYSSNKIDEQIDDKIDDSAPSEDTTYSSSKIEQIINNIHSLLIDDEHQSADKTYSSNKIESKFANLPKESFIDDTTARADKAYSSSKVEDLIANIPIPPAGAQIDDDHVSTTTTYSSDKIESLGGREIYISGEQDAGTWIDDSEIYSLFIDNKNFFPVKIPPKSWGDTPLPANLVDRIISVEAFGFNGGYGEKESVFTGGSVRIASIQRLMTYLNTAVDDVGTVGLMVNNGGETGINFALDNLTVGKNYDVFFNFDCQDEVTYPASIAPFPAGAWGFVVEPRQRTDYLNYAAWPENIKRDTHKQACKVTFTATASTMYLAFNLSAVNGATNNMLISNLFVLENKGQGECWGSLAGERGVSLVRCYNNRDDISIDVEYFKIRYTKPQGA